MRLAIICGGRPSVDIVNNTKPLLYIQNSILKIKETLSQNSWVCKENCISKDITIDSLDNFFRSLRRIVKDKEVKELLFYYTGHGMYGNSKSKVDFQLRLESEQITIGQLVDALNKVLENQKTPKIALVIDSCYSGEAVTKTTPYTDIEVLTSTDEDTKSYEKKGLDNKNPNFGISVFSHYFCEAFNVAQEKDELCLEFIGEHIKNAQDGQTPYYDRVQGRDKIVIGYNSQINEIYQALKTKHISVKGFREAILVYLKDNVLNFKMIQALDNYQELFEKLLEEKACLYCLLKELGLDEKYLNRVKRVDDCVKYKEEIAKRRSLKSIILVIRKSTRDTLDDCVITCHEEKNDGRYNISSRSLSNIDFTNKESYEQAISRLLSDKLISENVLELKLILPEELLKEDFDTLQIKTAFGRKKSLKEVFHISKKILMRFEEYKTIGYFERWKNNQNKFNTLKAKSVEEHTFVLNKKEEISFFGKRITSGEIKNGMTQEYLAVHSFYPLDSEEYIIDMVEYGLPIVISSREFEAFQIKWEKCSVSDMKLALFNHIDCHNRFFIYDNYDEVVSLQKAIEADKKRSS